MKVRPFPIRVRYAYDPDRIQEHGSPLYDSKYDRAIKPNTTVRVGSQILTPKQIVYILHHPHVRGTPDDPNPPIAMPRYLLHVDGNPENIRIENLEPSSVSKRWSGHVSRKRKETDCVTAADGTLIPKHLLMNMPPELRERFGVPSDVEM